MDITRRLKRDLEATAASEYTTFAPGRMQGLCADALNEIQRLERRLEEAGVHKPFAERILPWMMGWLMFESVWLLLDVLLSAR